MFIEFVCTIVFYISSSYNQTAGANSRHISIAFGVMGSLNIRWCLEPWTTGLQLVECACASATQPNIQWPGTGRGHLKDMASEAWWLWLQLTAHSPHSKHLWLPQIVQLKQIAQARPAIFLCSLPIAPLVSC